MKEGGDAISNLLRRSNGLLSLLIGFSPWAGHIVLTGPHSLNAHAAPS